MDESLHDTAERLLDAAPTSVEMPAGAGKTHLLAAAVATATERGHRSLVLTHTNAGVDAIRRRLRRFGVSSSQARVETITSWAFSLVCAYPTIAGVEVVEDPDWAMSDEYVRGATAVVASEAISDVHAVSFDYLFVDEYQDCTLLHHAFIKAIATAVAKTIIFGDRLQAIFGFTGSLTEWDQHVLPNFPALLLEATPHRWLGHNEELGQWLLDIRLSLVEGQVFDFAAHTVPGLTFVQEVSPTAIATAAYSFTDYDETVVLLDKWPSGVADHASRLGGSYSVMEDINGNFMREQINGFSNDRRTVLALPDSGDPALARWFAQFAKACIIGLADLNDVVLRRLSKNESLNGISRDGIQSVIDSLEVLRLNPTYEQLAHTARAVREMKELRVYRWEAWNDTLQAIAMSAGNAEKPIDNLTRIRERLRRQGRRAHSRIASRTLLVKGLEYDHVIIADLANFTDPRNLYVALTRARKSVTILGRSAKVMLRNEVPRP